MLSRQTRLEIVKALSWTVVTGLAVSLPSFKSNTFHSTSHHESLLLCMWMWCDTNCRNKLSKCYDIECLNSTWLTSHVLFYGTGKHEASFQAFRGHSKQTRPRTKPKMAGRLGREGSTKFIRQIETVIIPAGKLGPCDAKDTTQSTQRTRFWGSSCW